MENVKHKSGYINIIGNPNVGKSTLMNQFTGENLSIITSKAQTTRHRILGIVNGDDFQLIYSDTPGILKPQYKLQESMMGFVTTALQDADVILYVTDINETFDKNQEFLDKLVKTDTPVLLLINKIDISNQEMLERKTEELGKALPNAEIFPVSAKENFNLGAVFKRVLELTPENPPYFPKDELTDKPMRFFVSEIIREKILLFYQQEIPYSVEIEIESYKDEEKITRISAVLYCARQSQKGILIGHQGKALKKVGTEARKDMEEFLGKKVFLEMHVKVKKDWRDDERSLKQFGYK